MESSGPPENKLQLANAGDVAAMLDVARFYDSPAKYGNKKDARQAFLWYKKAVETRPSRTMTKLTKELRVLMMGRMGHFLIAGHGTSKNKAEGLALMVRAAELGSASGALLLGLMRSHCTTRYCVRTNTQWADFKLKRNDEEAIYWLELALGEHCPLTLHSLSGSDKEAAKKQLEIVDPVRRAAAEKRRKEAEKAEEERRKNEAKIQTEREEKRKADAAKRALLDGIEVAKELTVEEKIKEQMEQVRLRGEEIDLLSP